MMEIHILYVKKVYKIIRKNLAALFYSVLWSRSLQSIKEFVQLLKTFIHLKMQKIYAVNTILLQVK